MARPTRDRSMLEGHTELQKAIGSLTGVLPAHIVEELEKLGVAIEELVDEYVPVDTGALKASGEMDIYNNAVVVRFGKGLDYAIPVHENRENLGAKFLEAPAQLLGGNWKASRLDSMKGARARRLASRRFERLTG